jgi:ribonuclease HI
VGAGIVIIRPGIKTVELRYRMDSESINNQAEAFEILKALEHLQINQGFGEEVKGVTVYTDSRTTLDSLYNTDKHTFLTEEIRQKVHELEIKRMESKVQVDESPCRDKRK